MEKGEALQAVQIWSLQKLRRTTVSGLLLNFGIFSDWSVQHMRGILVALLVHKIADRIRDDLTSSTGNSSIDRT